MERLTNKKIGIVVKGTISEEVKERALIYEKLQQLENIEEELGIDLITLFRAKKEGIYYKTINHNIYYISKNCLCLEFNDEWELWVENHLILDGLLINLKDYGKTWWLEKPKEELENE